MALWRIVVKNSGNAAWKRRVCLTPSGTRDLTPWAK